MCQFEKNVNVSWQLVSQFISWDFCRYMSKQSESQALETDIFTFLRNMVIARTEKSTAEITKHEIVAKFIMEIRTIQSRSRIPCHIIDLSETVKRICPELKIPTLKLLHHLTKLLDEYSQEDVLTELRIAHHVNQFVMEASKVLPSPDLLQVVTTCLHPYFQTQKWKGRQKSVENIDLYQKVLKVLRDEIKTSFEATTIALALYEDKALEKIILNSETETENDFQQNNQFIQSSQVSSVPSDSEQSLQLYTQHKVPNPIQETELPNSAGSFTLESTYPESSRHQSQSIHSSQDPVVTTLPQNSVDPLDQLGVTQCIQNIGSLNSQNLQLLKPNPESLFRSASLQHPTSFDSDFSPKEMSAHNKKKRKHVPQIQSDFSDVEDDDNLPASKATNHGEASSSERASNFYVRHYSESDTSDCDKDTEFHFLTPTMYKADSVPQEPARNRVVFLSDNESDDSSIAINPDNSKVDPTFRTKKLCISKPKDPYMLPLKKRIKKMSNCSSKTQLQNTSIPKMSRQATLRGFGFSSTTSYQNVPPKKVPEKTCFKLFDDDFVVPEPADENILFQKNVEKNKGKTKKNEDNLGNKILCDECSKVFKTSFELNRHVFRVHTIENFNSADILGPQSEGV